MEKLSKIVLTFLLVFYSLKNLACQCESVPPLNLQYVNSTQMIFRGSIFSVSKCNGGIAKANFKIYELFKGIATESIDIYFECSEECESKFKEGEQWIIYANYEQIGKPKIDFCSRSRKLIENEVKIKSLYVEQDVSFEDELEFLEKNFEKKSFIKKNENAELSHRNIIPQGISRVVLIVISLLALLITYFLVQKKMK